MEEGEIVTDVHVPGLAHDISQIRCLGGVKIRANLYFLALFHPFCIPGMAFLPASISYLVGTNLFGILANRMGR